MLPGLEQLILACAPQVAPSTMRAIVRVESGGRPYALNVNGAQKLLRQPRSRHEAEAWASWLVARGYSVDLGLAQVNSGNLARLGLSPAQLLDPCINLRAGARILTESYLGAARRYGGGQTALRAALSAYNTGNYRAGLANGYVARVTAAADTANHANPANAADSASVAAPPLLPTHTAARRATRPALPGEPRTPEVLWVRR